MSTALYIITGLVVFHWLLVLTLGLLRRQGEHLIEFYLEKKKNMILQMGKEADSAVGITGFRN